MLTVRLVGVQLLLCCVFVVGVKPLAASEVALPTAGQAADGRADALPHGAVLRIGGLEFCHGTTVTAVAYSPDGKTLAAGGNATIRLLDPVTGKEIRSLPGHAGGICSLAFAPDGKSLAVGCSQSDPAVRLWDVATGKLLHALSGHKHGVDTVAFSPDGKTLASREIRTLRFWDVAAGKELRSWTRSQNRMTGMAFLPDGKPIAAMNHDDAIRLWDATANQEIQSCTGHRQGEQGWWTLFSPDGKLLVGMSEDRTLRLWESATGKLLRVLPAHDRDVETAILSPDSKTLAVADGGQIRLWELATGKEYRVLAGHRSAVLSLAFTPDGGTLASGSHDGTILIWRVFGGSTFDAKHVSALWTDLASADAAPAYRALDALASQPQEALRFLQQRLPKPEPLDPKRIAQLIADLDHQQFAVRQRATDELAKLVERGEVERALRQALDGKPSLELRTRLEQLLVGMPVMTSEELRWLRVIQALELLGGAQAEALLKALGQDAATKRVRQDALSALERLARRAAR